jgi:hypothetical protein
MHDNKDYELFYSRIEIFCTSNIVLPSFNKDKCFYVRNSDNYNQLKKYEVCAREFNDYNSTIDCLYEIEKIWKNMGIVNSLQYPNFTDECASIIIYNRWGLDLAIGMYRDRWLLSLCSKYTYEWKENRAKNTRNEEEKMIVLRIPYCQEESEDEFISKEKVCSLLKKWLETNDRSGDFDGNQRIAYMKEILRWPNSYIHY